MKNFFYDLVRSFLGCGSSLTAMTAIGLIAAILYATAAPAPGAAIICAIIAVLGVVTIAYQWHQAFVKLREEEKQYGHAKRLFDQMPDEWKLAVSEIASGQRLSMMANGYLYDQFRQGCPFVVDVGIGRLFLHQQFAHLVARLVNDWKAERRLPRASSSNP
ncbi:MAG TPA: hypothetical protein VK395_15190 [Gemmataceae bacterium]|nr:hypothetical protein [Gemmataceae bacterium]